jgi:O-acetyl-ADP-ribose deacetylase
MTQILFTHIFDSGVHLHLVDGDITAERVDAIVNAANENLVHGGGVAGAIVRRGGFSVQQESNEWVRRNGPLKRGQAAVTAAGALPCHAIIHVAGPMWGEGDEDSKLRVTVRAALRAAEEQRYASLAIPAISTGIYGFPKERGAKIILDTIAGWADVAGESKLREIRISLWDQPTRDIFLEACRSKWR